MRMKKIRAAKYILQCYRRYKLRQYIGHLQEIGGETRRLYQNKAVSADEKARLEHWPTPPKALCRVVATIRRIYLRWRAWLLLRRIPREQWAEYRLKIIAISALANKRQNYGLHEKWHGNYLALAEYNLSSNQFTNATRNCFNGERILFSSRVCKASSSFFHKSRDRLVVVTTGHIYQLDPNSYKIQSRIISICDITGVGLSKGTDQLVAIQVRGGNDLVIALVDSAHLDKLVSRAGEFTATILQQYSM